MKFPSFNTITDSSAGRETLLCEVTGPKSSLFLVQLKKNNVQKTIRNKLFDDLFIYKLFFK